MSLPPQIIRVKRKRVEEAPVTFLQLDKDGTKRRRSDVNWVYQRREASTRRPGYEGNQMPVIHVAGEPTQQKIEEHPTPTEPEAKSIPGASEPRRFHVSRSMLAAAANKPAGGNIFKKERHGPTVFVERTRKKLAPRPRRSLAPQALLHAAESDDVQQKDLKRPGVSKKTPTEAMETKSALPASLTNRANEDMSKITADMNDWVLREVGANLAQMDEDRKAEQRTPTRFKPKAPVKRYQERHPAAGGEDTEMSNTGTPTELSDEDGDDEDWIIEEYVRVPANYMAVDVNPSDIGVLVLEGDEDTMLFYGSLNDDDDELAEDEEDENAENHYTADYPEDEVASDDEYGRNPYSYRTYNASDDEEFDENDFDDEEEIAMEGDLDDDARMARIIERMKRQRLTTEQQLAQDYE